MKEEQFIQAYTIKEVSKQIIVPNGTIRQWEKDFNGLLIIPRTKQGARFYTEKEISLLLKIKQMRDKNLGKEMIRELLQMHLQSESPNFQSHPLDTNLTKITERTSSGDNLAPTIGEFKDTLITEIKEELRNAIRKEVVEEVKKEISKSSLYTVKSLSDSIYKSTEKTKEEINMLSGKIENSSKRNSDTLGILSHTIAKAAEHTHKKFQVLSEHIEQATDYSSIRVNNLENSVEQFSKELLENINTDRQYYIETIDSFRDQFREEIRQRENVFQEMVNSFRDAAAVKEHDRKWWEFWK